jgi:hypothetical protein
VHPYYIIVVAEHYGAAGDLLERLDLLALLRSRLIPSEPKVSPAVADQEDRLVCLWH